MLARRRFLATALSFSALALLPHRARAASERTLAFDNLHTGEKISATFWADGNHLKDGCAAINKVLRDHRSGEIATISTELLDLLYLLDIKLESSKPYEVISGYRSPATNESLARAGNGVSHNSLHMKGMAIDIRVAGRSLVALRDTAMTLKGGGVGYYPKSDFVHVDVGRIRYW